MRGVAAPVLVFVRLGAALLASGCGARDDSPRPPNVPVASAAKTAASPPPVPTASPEPAASTPSGMTEEDLRAAFFAIAPDPPPPRITLDTHYVVSNEDRPQVYRPRVLDRGGAYVGVGAEQGLMFAGWARADRMFLLDFDDWVVIVNEIHGLVLSHASTPDELYTMWGPDARADVERWLAEVTPESAVLARKMRVYDRVRPQVEYRLKWLRQHLTELKVPFFANDQAEFEHVASLFRSGRARAVRGDLTASGALRSFGDLARRAGFPVRVLYLSNAEQYFDYTTGHFRDNVASLPFDERSVVLHTTPTRKTDYFYVWQDARTYASWTASVANFRDMLYQAKMPYRGKLENGTYWIEPQPR